MIKIVGKIYGAPGLSSHFTNLPFYECPSSCFFTAFQPKREYFKGSQIKDVESFFRINNKISVVNLIFDENYSKNEMFVHKIDEQFVTNVGDSQLKDLVALYNYIFNIVISDFNITQELWIPHEPTLTPRQVEILFHVYNGLSSKQIAEKLSLSPRTIELHRQNSIVRIGDLTPKKLESFFSPVIVKAYSEISL